MAATTTTMTMTKSGLREYCFFLRNIYDINQFYEQLISRVNETPINITFLPKCWGISYVVKKLCKQNHFCKVKLKNS